MKADQRFTKSGLSRATLTHQAKDFVLCDVERNAIYSMENLMPTDQKVFFEVHRFNHDRSLAIKLGWYNAETLGAFGSCSQQRDACPGLI